MADATPTPADARAINRKPFPVGSVLRAGRVNFHKEGELVVVVGHNPNVYGRPDWITLAGKPGHYSPEQFSRATTEEIASALNARANLTAEIAEGATGAGNARGGDGWQPIETAPKDGSGIIVIDMTAERPEPGNAWWLYDVWTAVQPIGAIALGRDVFHAMTWPNPTHWQPLPEPPATPVGAIAEGRE